MQKLAKEQAAAFVDLLRDTTPGVTSITSLSDVESTARGDERWLVMSADRRSVAEPPVTILCTARGNLCLLLHHTANLPTAAAAKGALLFTHLCCSRQPEMRHMISEQ